MSSNAYTDSCPCCGETAQYYSENKPFEYVTITCPYCWFYTYPTVWRMTVEATIEEQQEYSQNELNETMLESDIKKAIKFYNSQKKNFEEFSGFMDTSNT